MLLDVECYFRMSRLIFNLKNVTDEEAEEVRQLLADNDIGIYETNTGFFGTSTAGYWLHEPNQESLAKSLLKQYAQDRAERVRLAYQIECEQGLTETFWQRCLSQPLRLFFAILAIGFILFVSLVPFMEFIV